MNAKLKAHTRKRNNEHSCLLRKLFDCSQFGMRIWSKASNIIPTHVCSCYWFTHLLRSLEYFSLNTCVNRRYLRRYRYRHYRCRHRLASCFPSVANDKSNDGDDMHGSSVSSGSELPGPLGLGDPLHVGDSPHVWAGPRNSVRIGFPEFAPGGVPGPPVPFLRMSRVCELPPEACSIVSRV